MKRRTFLRALVAVPVAVAAAPFLPAAKSCAYTLAPPRIPLRYMRVTVTIPADVIAMQKQMNYLRSMEAEVVATAADFERRQWFV